MIKLKRLHYWIGLIGIISFLLTGQYMGHFYDHLKDLPDGMRMLFRSGHIYFLMASIINLILGVYLTPFTENRKVVLQFISSTIIILAPILLLIGFFTEAHMQNLVRPYSRIGIYALFGSSLLFIYFGFSKQTNKEL
jgi:Ni,Fe-hydrogenase I cytochrome b subunit